MNVEFARKRIAKIRNDYAHSSLLNKLGLVKNKEYDSAEEYVSLTEIR